MRFLLPTLHRPEAEHRKCSTGNTEETLWDWETSEQNGRKEGKVKIMLKKHRQKKIRAKMLTFISNLMMSVQWTVVQCILPWNNNSKKHCRLLRCWVIMIMNDEQNVNVDWKWNCMNAKLRRQYWEQNASLSHLVRNLIQSEMREKNTKDKTSTWEKHQWKRFWPIRDFYSEISPDVLFQQFLEQTINTFWAERKSNIITKAGHNWKYYFQL